MRKILLVAASAFIGISAYSQQDPQYSHYMFDRLSINPGYTGIDNKICITGIFREQWAGFEGQPQTFLLNVHGPVKTLRGGVGLSYFNDQLGFFKHNVARLSYSYHLPAGPGILGMGISAGIISSALNPTWVAIDPVASDGAIPDASISQTTYDIGFGLYYKTNDLYVGLSSTHLTESDLNTLNVKNSRHYFLIAGWDKMINQQLTIRPSTRVESDGTSTQIDLNVNGLYNFTQTIGAWLGVGYRVKDAIVPMFGYQQVMGSGMLKIGFSYDVTTSEIKNYSSGSIEGMVNYCFTVDKPPVIQKSKNPRFL